MKALVENGPLSVSFEVYDDFMMYKSGVYHHTGALKSNQAGGSFDPFEVTKSFLRNNPACRYPVFCCS